MDILSDVLRALQLKGIVYFQADFQAPWGMDIKGGAFANFHIVARGECWGRAPFLKEPMHLQEGALVVFPNGERHALLCAPDAEASPADEALAVQASTKGKTSAASTTSRAPSIEVSSRGARLSMRRSLGDTAPLRLR